MTKKKAKKQKTMAQILMEYARTVFASFLVALVFTTLLSIHARSEMIKNLYINPEEQQKLDEQLARQLVTQSDFTKDLMSKKYSVCMQVGNLYETAHDYADAEIAFRFAVDKARPGVYAPYIKLASVLIAQEKFKETEYLINSVKDVNNKHLIKFKTRSYIDMGDKYYSIGKFLSAAKCYEKADYYYNRFVKRDKKVERAIDTRAANAYLETADVMVKNGYNSEAVRFLKKAEHNGENYNRNGKSLITESSEKFCKICKKRILYRAEKFKYRHIKAVKDFVDTVAQSQKNRIHARTSVTICIYINKSFNLFQ